MNTIKSPCIAVPFFGGIKYHSLLKSWVAQYKLSKSTWPYVVITNEDFDNDDLNVLKVDISVFKHLIRDYQPFDVKGAIVAAAALQIDAMLVLDADAMLMRCPAGRLKGVMNSPIAMPMDHGSMMHWRSNHLDYPYDDIGRRCAGVMWLGASSKRGELVQAYERAWLELKHSMPWTPQLPHLLEQNAWTVAHHTMGGGDLSILMNWAPHFLGHNPFAVVNHYYGYDKAIPTPQPSSD